MLFPLTPDDLTAAVPRDEVLRTDPAAAAEVIAVPDAVAFLSEVGVPWCSGAFQLNASLAAPSTSARSGLLAEEGDLPMVVDTPVGQLGALGSLQYALVYVRRGDGGVFAASEDADDEYELINTDVSSLAQLLLLIERKSPDPRLPYAESHPLYLRAADEIEAEMRAGDPAPFADPQGFWTGYLDSYSGGMYPRRER